MARRAEVQVNLRRIEEYIPPGARKALLAQMAALAIGRIKRRTGQGVDVAGAKFAPYSARYAAQRKASGRDTTPKLLLTGATLGSMQVLSNDGARAVIGFAGSSARVRFAPRVRKAKTASQVKREQAWKTKHTFRETNEQIANALKARWNDRGEGSVPRRHFFGLSKDDQRELMRHALRSLMRIVQEASFRTALFARRK